MSHLLNQNIHQVLWTPLEVWLGEHPLMHWLLAHPFILLGVGLTLLLLLAGLMSAIAHLTQNLWLRLLQLPVQLIQGIGMAIATVLTYVFQRLFRRSSVEVSDKTGEKADVSSVLSNLDSDVISPPSTDLRPLLERLEMVRREESELIEQIKALVKEGPDSV